MASSGQTFAAAVERPLPDSTSPAHADMASTCSGGNDHLVSPPYGVSWHIFAVKKEPFSSTTETSTLDRSDTVMHECSLSAPSPSQYFSNDVNLMPDMPTRHQGHRRAQSENEFRLHIEKGLKHGESFMFETQTVSDEASDDLFSMYIDADQINSNPETFGEHMQQGSRSPSDTHSLTSHHGRSLSMDGVVADLYSSDRMYAGHSKPGHQHSNSMDDSVPGNQGYLPTPESSETKKAMDANKLAELALLDPKRAKRVLANRQSAARSKERKVKYISELERTVQTLQTKATTLSAQLTLLQRDTSGLISENSELKLRLQSMEQQAQLCDALNDALREEVQRLKIVTGQHCMGSKQMILQASHQQ